MSFQIKNGGPPPAKKIKLTLPNDTNGITKKPNTFGPISANLHKYRGNLQEQRKKLPIYTYKDQVVEFLTKHKTSIIIGETGCGKTTQLPQYISSAKINGNGKIAITQPRRVAAISLATRVALEYGNDMGIGDYVGYSVRFEDVTSKKTKIKFLTDGMLLKEAMSDKLLTDYTVIMLDEAHERTIHTDVLFGIVKKAQKVREERSLTPLKIIISSATMDVDHFAKYFNDCPVGYIEGRMFPIKLYNVTHPTDSYLTTSVQTFFQIHRTAPADHHVLIFLTGQEEIETCAHLIRILSKDPEVKGPPVKVCPLYAAQPSIQQMAVFAPTPPGTRKVVISTNIAETSVTIGGIKYVIDSGMVKNRSYVPSIGLGILKVERISREQADQRAGRAGRESEGFCYRLYTVDEQKEMEMRSKPEIQKANLSSVALQLLTLGVHILNFDFLDKPPQEAVQAAFENLKRLGAVKELNSVTLTPLGKKMAQFPLDPQYSKVLIKAEKYKCLKEVIVIVAMMASESILINPPSKREQAREARQKFFSGYGDHITLLNIYRQFEKIGKNNVRSWCHEHFINVRNITYVRDVVEQLQEICNKCDISSSSCGTKMDELRKCLLAGLYTNVAELQPDRKYVTVHKRQTCEIHPSSVLHQMYPDYIIFSELVQTNKCCLRDITTVDGEWFDEVAPDYFQNRNLRLS